MNDNTMLCLANARGKFGRVLVSHILAEGYTIKEFAEKIGIHPQQVSKHIRQLVRPRSDSIKIYAEELGEPFTISHIADLIDNDWRNNNGR